MTTIHYEQTGGMLGREIVSDIDLNQIPPEEAQEIMRMIADTNFFDFPQNLIARATPDEYEYTISLDAGNTHHTIHTSDSNAPESMRPLLVKLSTLAKASQPGATEK